jgi:hypothetical protein
MAGLSEIRESDAPPELAAIYAEMRRTMRLPLVNLIWRHLATLPGILPWAWSLVRPAARSGALDAALARVQAAAPRLDLGAPPLGPHLDDRAESEVRAILAAYNRGNGMNLVALAALRLAFADPGAIRRAAPEAAAPSAPAAVAPIRSLPRLGELDQDTAACVRELAQLHGGGPDVVPSLYLHLAHWPTLLGAVADRVRPRLADGAVERARAATLRLGETEAQGLIGVLATDQAAPQAHLAEAREAVDQFASHMIPAMIPLGLALERLMARGA